MTQQDKERIEKDADALLLKYPADSALQEGRKKFYIAGATAEHDRLTNERLENLQLYSAFEERVKHERNKAIDEAKIKVKGLRDSVSEKEYGKTYFNIAYTSVIIELENLKH